MSEPTTPRGNSPVPGGFSIPTTPQGGSPTPGGDSIPSLAGAAASAARRSIKERAQHERERPPSLMQSLKDSLRKMTAQV